MKTVIICISDTYLERGKQLRQYYESLGDQVVIYTPDFSHRQKTYIENQGTGIEYLHHRPYKRNLSGSRLLGHWEFAQVCRKQLEKESPDRVHCLIPANSLARQMAKYKREHPACQLIFDLNDLWPESLPMKGIQNWPFFFPWKQLRDGNLNSADLIICECRLFADVLQKKDSSMCPEIVYWAGPPLQPPEAFQWNEQRIELAYLGSVNNIIDIDLICRLIQTLSQKKPVVLHVIGAGENLDQFLLRAKEAGAQVQPHGEIYDPQEKLKIFSHCQFGLNIMKPEICVGLSLKSLDYLAAGLPLLNSIRGDTWQLIEQDGFGINLTSDTLEQVSRQVLMMDGEQNQTMRAKARKVYEEHFTPEAFNHQMDDALRVLIKGKKLKDQQK